MSDGIVLQPGLGKFSDNNKPGDSVGGYLALAKVVKVHHKHNTVDVQIIKTNNLITSSDSVEGKFGARLLVPNAHCNLGNMTSSGVVEPIQEGQLVVLAFLDSSKKEPIILGSFHDTTEMKNNILTQDYPVDINRSLEEYREGLKYLRVFPSQAYIKVDGIGATEYSHPSKSFFIMDPDLESKIDDSHQSFDHKDLSVLNQHSAEVMSAGTEESALPVKVLMVHRDCFLDGEGGWTKFFMDTDGSTRVTRDPNDGSITYVELTGEGHYKIRRQIDSNTHGQGALASEIEIDKDGNISISHKSGSSIKFTEEGDIIIKPKRHLLLD